MKTEPFKCRRDFKIERISLKYIVFSLISSPYPTIWNPSALTAVCRLCAQSRSQLTGIRDLVSHNCRFSSSCEHFLLEVLGRTSPEVELEKYKAVSTKNSKKNEVDASPYHFSFRSSLAAAAMQQPMRCKNVHV